MYKLKTADEGFISPLLVSFIFVLLLFIAAASAAVWAYSSQQDYKNNFDVKVQKAVSDAVTKAQIAKDAEYAEKDKSPLKEYDGPEAYGSIVIKYPKTWSAFVSEGQNDTTPVDGYFYPNFVPGGAKAYALRVQVVNANYDAIVQQQNDSVKAGKTTATAFRPTLVNSQLGIKFDGDLPGQKHGSMVVVKIRDKTLVIWTEADQFTHDFNSLILPNFSFSP